MQNFIASEVKCRCINIHLQEIYTPTRNIYTYKWCTSDLYTSNWSECYNHGTSWSCSCGRDLHLPQFKCTYIDLWDYYWSSLVHVHQIRSRIITNATVMYYGGSYKTSSGPLFSNWHKQPPFMVIKKLVHIHYHGNSIILAIGLLECSWIYLCVWDW
jgi:hypothetical protein